VDTSPTVLLDSSNLAMRSYHAGLGTGMHADGEHTAALVLFVNSLAKLLAEIKPSRFVACWDSGGSAYRERIYPQYKWARRQAAGIPGHTESFRLIKQFLQLSGLAQWHKDGVEADDLIAAAYRRTDGPKLILSGDKDLLQLIDDETEQIRFTGSVRVDRWDTTRVRVEYGCEPHKLALVMALSGDSSDGIPGLAGIGPKRAVKMLAAADWDWDTLLATLSDGQVKQATMCRALVDLNHIQTLVPPVPMYDPHPRFSTLSRQASAELVALYEFCDRYRLSHIRHRLETRTLWW
jgi:DNA polymerase-1